MAYLNVTMMKRARVLALLGRRLPVGQRSVSFGVLAIVAAVLLLVGGGAVYARLGGTTNPSSASSIDLQKGLVGWWKLDGNTKDASPYAHNGTGTNVMPATDRKSTASGALSFDGTSSGVDTGYTASLNTFTASIWVYQTKSGSYQTAISNTRDCCGTGYVGFDLATSYVANNVVFKIWNGGSGSVANVSGATTDLNTWDLFTASYDGTTMKLYKNGALVNSSTSFSGTLGTSTTTIKIGRTGAVTGGLFGGSLDDARVYNRALTENEVAALYKSYDASLRSSSGESGLVGWWKLDGNAKDSTPYGNDGTVSSVTAVADRKNIAGKAYAFDGSVPSRISLSSTGPYTKFGTTSFTVMSWIKTSESLTQRCIMSTAGGPQGWRFGYYQGKPYYLVGDGTNYQESTIGTATVNDGAWHHLAIAYAYTGTNWVLTAYIDGVSTGTVSLPATIGSVNNSMGLIGTMNGTANNGAVTGSIDDVRTYNRALAQPAIRQIAQSYNSQINLNTSPQSTPNVNLGQGLIGYWPFNGNAKDATPYGNNGTVSGALTAADRKGRAASAYTLGSTNQWINVGSPTAYSALPSAFTYSLWVNYNGTASTGQWPEIMGASNTHIYYGFRTSGYGTNLYFEYGKAPCDGSAFASLNNYNYILPQNTWHLATVTYDGSTLKMYIDGAYKTQAAGVSLCPAYGGLSFTTSGSGWNGSVDDARVYNRPISATEVQALYESYR